MSTSDRQQPKLSLRSPEDIIAIVPYLVGFEPTDSLVVIGLTGKAVEFAGRLDLPTDPAELPDYRHAVEYLADATARNATSCLLVAYGPAPIVTPVMDLARETMPASGLPVLDALRVTDDRYRSAVMDLGERAVVELVALLGYYTMVSFTLNVFEVPAPGGARPLD